MGTQVFIVRPRTGHPGGQCGMTKVVIHDELANHTRLISRAMVVLIQPSKNQEAQLKSIFNHT